MSRDSREGGFVTGQQLLLAMVVVIALAGIVVAWHHAHQQSRSTVSVVGIATVQGRPDTATFQMALHTTGATAAAALSTNNVKMNSLLHVLHKDGVPSRDIQTSGLNVYQNFNTNNQPTGYGVDDSVTVSIRGLSRAGTIVGDAVLAGGGGVSVDGVTLSISNQSSLLREARIRAMHDARQTAAQLARAAGSRIIGVVSIVDQESQPTPPIVFNGFKAAGAMSSPTPISGGNQSISDQVTVVYQIAS